MSAHTPLPRPSAVLWDMDGTLIDQTAAIINCYQQVIVQMGYKSPDPERIRRSLGGPMASTMGLFVEESRLAEASIAFRALFPQIMFEGLIIFPGARDLIQCFAQASIPQGILTNKHGPTARIVSENCSFAQNIPVCIGNTDTEWHKPQADLTLHVLSQMGVTAEGACMIGDSPTDVETAINANIPCYAVATGAHSIEELEASGAAQAFPSLKELNEALNIDNDDSP